MAGDISQVVNFDPSPVLTANQTYYLKLEMVTPEGRVNACGPLRILIQTVDQTTEQVIDSSAPCTIAWNNPVYYGVYPTNWRDLECDCPGTRSRNVD